MLTTVHFAHIAAQPQHEKTASIVTMTLAERDAYARYLDAIAFDYIDEVPADYVAPTAASVLAEAQAVLASQEAAPAPAKPLYCPNCGHAYTQKEFEVGYDARWSTPENFYLPCCGADGWASLTTISPALATSEPNIPLLMDVEAEVVAVTAQMEAEGFAWSDEAQTWVRATEAAIEAAETFDADYDAWLDSLPGDQPSPEDLAVEAA